MNQHITVVIHARNAKKHIEECVQSAQLLTDDVVVVDAESTDETATLARKAGAKVYTHQRTDYVEPARTFDVEKASGPWVFILDTDERMTRELAEEIKNELANKKGKTHYRVPRKNIFAQQKWLRHGGWWPDYVSGRLLNKAYFVKWPVEIHSRPEMKGIEGTLSSPFLHYFHSSLENMVISTTIYENIEAQLLRDAGRIVTTKTLFRKFVGEFFRRFVKKLGFMDGPLGIIESVYQAYSKTITWILVYEKNHFHTK